MRKHGAEVLAATDGRRVNGWRVKKNLTVYDYDLILEKARE